MSPISSDHLYQIFWDEATRASNDPGFAPLDNLSNERPDWSEYWPIRRFLQKTPLYDGLYYGFFSPKFFQKTGLKSSDVREFLNRCSSDVVVFSPFMDQSSFALNIFEQAAANHPTIYPILKKCVERLMPDVNLNELVMTSRTSIFCNYFVAKKDFWARWLHECEVVFSICEANSESLALEMNLGVQHAGGKNPAKVFMIERIASLLLATSSRWTVTTYDPIKLPFATSKVAEFRQEIIILEGLKQLYLQNRNAEVLQAFYSLRQRVIERLTSATATPHLPHTS